MSAILTDTPVKAALEAEAQTHANPVKYNRLFSDSQETSRKPKQLIKNVRKVDWSEEEDKCFCI
jgi:hypothetical protein